MSAAAWSPLLANLLFPLGAPVLPVPVWRALAPGRTLDAATLELREHADDGAVAAARRVRDEAAWDTASAALLTHVVAPVIGRRALVRATHGPRASTVRVLRRGGAFVDVTTSGSSHTHAYVDETTDDLTKGTPPHVQPDQHDVPASEADTPGDAPTTPRTIVLPSAVLDPDAPPAWLDGARARLAATLGLPHPRERSTIADNGAVEGSVRPRRAHDIPHAIRDLDTVFLHVFGRVQRAIAEAAATAPAQEESEDPAGRPSQGVDGGPAVTEPRVDGIRVGLARGCDGAASLALIDALACESCARRLVNAPPLRWVELVVAGSTEDERARVARLIGATQTDLPLLRGTYGGVAFTVAFAPTGEPIATTRRPLFDRIVLIDDDHAPLRDDEPSLAASQLQPGGCLLWAPDAPPRPERPLPAAEPLTDPREDDIAFALLRWWGHAAFRPGQWPVVVRVLRGESVLGILPTGAGKTVCFQLPALLLGGLTLVCSPLQSLIDDQVDNLDERGLRGAIALHANRDGFEVQRSLRRIRKGQCRLVYLSPERFQSRSFSRDLEAASRAGRLPVRALVLDEAHLASEWGHDFRPSYLNLPDIHRTLFPHAPLVLLTATASRAIRTDLVSLLGLPPDATILPDAFDRPELAFAVRRIEGDLPLADALVDLLQEDLPQMLGAADHTGLHGDGAGAYREGGLVFTPYTGARHRRRPLLTTEGVTEVLRAAGLVTQRFHGALSREDRQRAQRAFRDNRAPVMVATKGFGTGIDKPNVRWVVHMGYAGSLEAYYQEAGRGGRDRRDARAVLLWHPRADECRPSLEAPPCARDGRCAFGLDALCSHGVQATMRASNLRGVDEDLRVALAVWKELLASLDSETTASVPRTLRLASEPSPEADPSPTAERRPPNTHAPAPPSLAPGTPPAAATDPTARTARTEEVAGARVEHALLRLRGLGLVGRYWYGRRPDTWGVDAVVPLAGVDRTDVGDHLKRLLPRWVEREEAEVRWGRWARSVREDDDPLAGVASALRCAIEAWYASIGGRSWQMLENMEEFASGADCRRNRIVAWMNERAEPIEGGCGRCDNCGIAPLAEVQSARAAQAVRASSAARQQALDAATGTDTGIPDLIAAIDRVPADALAAVRDGLLRHLEDRPGHASARCALAQVRARLGDDARARADFALALENLIVQQQLAACETWTRLWDDRTPWEVVRNALRAHPRSPPTHALHDRLMYRAELRTGRRDEALARAGYTIARLSDGLAEALDATLASLPSSSFPEVSP